MAVLITAGAEAAAYRLKQILDQHSVFYFGDSLPLPRYSSTAQKFLKIPEGGSFSFAHELLALCLDNEINAVYPLRRAELLPLSEAKQLFAEYGIEIFVPDKDLLAVMPAMASTSSHLVAVLNGVTVNGASTQFAPTYTGVFCVDTDTSSKSLFIAD